MVEPCLRRLAKLEERARGLVIFNAAIATVLAFSVCREKAIPDTVEARQFVVRDEQGRIIARLGPVTMPEQYKVNLSNAVGLTLSPPNSKSGVALGAAPAGALLVLDAERLDQESMAGRIWLDADQLESMIALEWRRRPGVSLRSGEFERSATVRVGDSVVTVGGSDDDPGVFLRDSEARLRGSFKLDSRGEARMATHGVDERVVAKFPD